MFSYFFSFMFFSCVFERNLIQSSRTYLLFNLFLSMREVASKICLPDDLLRKRLFYCKWLVINFNEYACTSPFYVWKGESTMKGKYWVDWSLIYLIRKNHPPYIFKHFISGVSYIYNLIFPIPYSLSGFSMYVSCD